MIITAKCWHTVKKMIIAQLAQVVARGDDLQHTYLSLAAQNTSLSVWVCKLHVRMSSMNNAVNKINNKS